MVDLLTYLKYMPLVVHVDWPDQQDTKDGLEAIVWTHIQTLNFL